MFHFQALPEQMQQKTKNAVEGLYAHTHTHDIPYCSSICFN